MKKLILLLLTAMATSFCGAQEIEWQRTICGNKSDSIFSIIVTNDGGYFIGGSSSSDSVTDKTENSLGGEDYWVVKLDSLGNILWQNTIGGTGTDKLRSVQQTSDGGFILGGFSNSPISADKTEDSIGGFDYWVIKLNTIGNIEWQNTIGGNANDYLISVHQTNDGGYALGGYSNSMISGDKIEDIIGGYDYWVIKLTSVGNISWQNTIGGTGDDILSSIRQASNNDLIIGGTSDSYISGDKTEDARWGSNDYWVLKINNFNGAIQWQKTIGGSNTDNLSSINETFDGGFVLAGSSFSDSSFDKSENGEFYDYWIVKLSSSGTIQWQNTIGGNWVDQLFIVFQTSDSGYFLGGRSESLIGFKKTESSLSVDDFWFVKLNSNGSIEWQNDIGGGVYDWPMSAKETSDGGYIIGGCSNSQPSGDKTDACNVGSWSEYWIVKLYGYPNSINGTIFLDANSNSIHDSLENGIQYLKINEQNTGRFGFSDLSGFYNVNVYDTGSFIVSPNPLNFYNIVPVSHSASFSVMQQTDSLNDFAFQPAGVFNDLCITITPLGPFRAGFNASYMINYGNYGTTTLSGDVIFLPFNNVTYVSSSVTPTAVTLDSVVWSTGMLSPFQTGSIVVTVNVNAGLPIGTLINSSVRIEPVANDANPGCNYSHWEVFTTGSIDPNDILVNEDTLTTTQLSTAPFLDYIIRFQNTGNDTAFTVKVLNPIDTNKLELSTIEFVNSSHPVNLNWINYQRNMEFKFDNILLPDSNTNEPLSHGFVHYRIKPKTTLLAGYSVTNNAYIYFDFNSPVATNTAVTKIVLPTGLAQEAVSSRQLVVYPNPAKDEITIQLNYANYHNQPIKVFDVYGKQIFSTRTTTRNQKLETLNYPQGVYFVQVGSLRAKFVKQ